MRATSIAGATGLAFAATMALGSSPASAAETIRADAIAHELRDIGATASIDEDSFGNPRVKTAVDRHDWVIVLQDCAGGSLEQRDCRGFQMIVDTEMPNPVPSALINKWNKEYRYARGTLRQDGRPGCREQSNCTARIATDVLITGTNGDPVKTFRAYFEVVKRRAAGFRKFISAPE